MKDNVLVAFFNTVLIRGGVKICDWYLGLVINQKQILGLAMFVL